MLQLPSSNFWWALKSAIIKDIAKSDINVPFILSVIFNMFIFI